MSRNGAVLLLLALCAGAAGGVAASLALRDPAPPAGGPAPPRAEEPGRDASARLDRFAEALAGLRLELATLRARIDRAEREPVRPPPGPAPGGAEEEDDDEPPPRPRGEAPPPPVVRPAAEPLDRSKTALRVTSPRAQILRNMAEETRWGKIREDLGLDPWQTSEVRQASEDLLAEIRDFTVRRETAGDPAADSERVHSSFERARDRIGRVLSEEQLRRFDSEGYGEAVGLGRDPPDLGPAFAAPRDRAEAR